MKTLTKREKAILHSRFGLNGGQPKKLEETRKKLRLTDERVRQIQNAALGKLRRRMAQLAKYATARRAGHRAQPNPNACHAIPPQQLGAKTP